MLSLITKLSESGCGEGNGAARIAGRADVGE